MTANQKSPAIGQRKLEALLPRFMLSLQEYETLYFIITYSGSRLSFIIFLQYLQRMSPTSALRAVVSNIWPMVLNPTQKGSQKGYEFRGEASGDGVHQQNAGYGALLGTYVDNGG